jgi:hypothetical protein
MLRQFLLQVALLTTCCAVPLACPAAYLQFTFRGTRGTLDSLRDQCAIHGVM